MAKYTEYKLAVVGRIGVGMSAVVQRMVKGAFVGDTDPEIEDSFRVLADVDGATVLLDILDVAETDVYQGMRDGFLRASEGLLLVYDITDASSLDVALTWLQRIHRAQCSTTVPVILVGNKLDLDGPDRQVSAVDAAQFAEQHGFAAHVEVSAKSGAGVQDVFEDLVRRVEARYRTDSVAKAYLRDRDYRPRRKCTIM